MGFHKKNKETMKEQTDKGTLQSADGVGNADTLQTAEAKPETAGGGGYQFAPDVKLRECRYCRVMIPKSAVVCPNCKMHLKKRWLRNMLLFVVCAAFLCGGVYLYVYEYRGSSITTVMSNRTTAVTEEPEQTAATTSAAEQEVAQEQETAAPEEAEESAGQGEGALAALQIADSAADTPETSAQEDTLTVTFSAQETAEESEAAEDTVTAEELAIVAAEVTAEDICGADGPILDYADETKVIFHDYYGLFVYDREEAALLVSLDLEAIGCQYTQGDYACEVTVDADGGNVYLRPVNEEVMYVLAVEEQTLTREPYAADTQENLFEALLTADCVETDPTVFRSVSCAALARRTYLYLESGSGMALDLCYVTEQNGKVQEREYLLADYEQQTLGTADAEDDMQLFSGAEEADFREECETVSYKALLRQQEEYLDRAFRVDVTVVEQVDGGLFDDNVYYLCMVDEDGVRRYYIVRDDRQEDDWLILEGDVLRIYGRLFGSCKLPASLVVSQPTVPALAMSYYDLLEE